MKQTDRDFIFSCINRICQALINEAEVLCEFIDDYEDREMITRHVASFEDDADNIKHEVEFYYQDNRLYREPECMMLLDVVYAIEKCTDIIYDVAKTFIRLNILEVKDCIISSFMSAGTGAVKMTELMEIMRTTRTGTPIKDLIELDHYSIEYMRIYDLNMNKLYVDGTDPLEVMRWTAVYDVFKDLFSSYEAVAEQCGKYSILMDGSAI